MRLPSRTEAEHTDLNETVVRAGLLRPDNARPGKEHRTRASEERAPMHYWLTSSARPRSEGRHSPGGRNALDLDHDRRKAHAHGEPIPRDARRLLHEPEDLLRRRQVRED